MDFDFNGDGQQANNYELIPANTIVPLVMKIRPGGAGEGGMLRQSRSSDAQMLDCEFTVESGQYARRKIFQMFILSGGRLDENGESMCAKISRQTLRAILESAHGIRPDDMSEVARAKRRINGWSDFDGLTFLAKLGIEKDKNGQYDDKNKIKAVIVPGDKDYARPGAAPSEAQWRQSQPATDPKPAWAR